MTQERTLESVAFWVDLTWFAANAFTSGLVTEGLDRRRSRNDRESTRVVVAAALDEVARWLRETAPAPISCSLVIVQTDRVFAELEDLLCRETALDLVVDSWVETADPSAVVRAFDDLVVEVASLIATVENRPTVDVELLSGVHDFLILFAVALDPEHFEERIDTRSRAHRDAEGVAERVARFLNREADVQDAVAYLNSVVDWANRTIPARFGLASSLAEMHETAVGVPDGAIGATPVRALFDECRVVILEGVAGAGKTWSAHYQMLSAAERAIGQLERGAALSDVRIPVFARCSDIQATADVWTALTSQTHREWPDRERARRLLSLPYQPIEVVLDGVDEALRTEDLEGHLLRLAKDVRTRMLVTTRPGQPWVREHLKASTKDHVSVISLKGLDTAGTQRLVQQLSIALGHPGVASVVLSRHASGALPEELLGTPLLTLLTVSGYCHAASEGRSVPRDRSELYSYAVESVLLREARRDVARPGGRWGAIHRHEIEERSPRWLDALTSLAMSTINSGEGRPSLEAVTQPAAWRAIRAEHGCDSIDVSIVRSLFDEGEEVEFGRLPFIHRTVQEHFVGRGVARLEPGAAARFLADGGSVWMGFGSTVARSVVLQSRLAEELIKQLSSFSESRPGLMIPVMLGVVRETPPERWTDTLRSEVIEAALCQADPTELLDIGSWNPSALEANLDSLPRGARKYSSRGLFEAAEALLSLNPSATVPAKKAVVESLRSWTSSFVSEGESFEDSESIAGMADEALEDAIQSCEDGFALSLLAEAARELAPSSWVRQRSKVVAHIATLDPLAVGWVAQRLCEIDVDLLVGPEKAQWWRLCVEHCDDEFGAADLIELLADPFPTLRDELLTMFERALRGQDQDSLALGRLAECSAGFSPRGAFDVLGRSLACARNGQIVSDRLEHMHRIRLSSNVED